MSLRGKLAFLLLGWLCVYGGQVATGQSRTTGQIVGTVRDTQRRGIPEAVVVATSAETGEKQQSITDESGDYVLVALPAGNYELTIRADGFSKSVFREISVGVGDTLTVNAILQIARSIAEITVNETPPLIRTDNSEIGTTLDKTTLVSTPLASRNSLQLIAAAPGANTALTNNSVLGRNSPQVSINGARVNQNSYQVNGVDANDIAMHDLGNVAVPAPESVSEVKVQASMYDASVSGAGGGTIELTTKSGTNQLHGTVYGYFRNDVLNANDPNLKAVGVSRPVLEQQVYGASVGGPVRKDRAFYFVSYQGLRSRNGASVDSLYSNVMVDPCLTNARSATTLIANCGVASVDPISLSLLNYKLPSGRFLIPTPQNGGLVSGTAPSTYREDQFNTNLDFRLSGKDVLTGKLFFASTPLFSALGESAFGATPTFPGFGTHIDVANALLALREIHAFNPSTVNEVRFGYNYIHRAENPEEPVQDSTFGIKRSTARQFPGLPLIYLNRSQGLTAIGSNELTLRNANPSYSFIDLLSLQRGKHDIRLGGQIRRSEWRLDSVNAASYGEIDFDSFQDFLSGNVAFSILGTGQSQADFRATDFHFFVQDDWKVSRRLTLNLGFRYEVNLPPDESQGRIGGFDPGLYVPSTQVDENGYPVGPPAEGIIMAGNASSQIALAAVTRVGKRIFKSIDPRDFAPRIGLAWSPLDSPRLAVRAGYGVFYSRPSFLYLGLNFASPPFYQASASFNGSFADPFSSAPPSSSFPQVQQGALLSSPWSFVDRNNLNPYFQQFNASVQYEIHAETVLQVAYVGSRGLRLYRQVNTNQARIVSIDHPITSVATGAVITTNTNDNASLRAPLQGVDPGMFSLNQSSGQSTYHSLQVSLTRRYLHGLQFAAAYAYSKSMDNTSAAGGGAGAEGSLDTSNGIDTSAVIGNQVDPRANRGVSDFDRTHRYTLNFVWALPVPKSWEDSGAGRRFVAGWQLSGFVTAMSGLPIDIYDPAGGTLYGSLFGARPNWVLGANRSTAMIHTPTGYYFNPYAFAQAMVQPGEIISSANDPTALAGEFGTDYGNVGRNILRGPSQTNLDLSVAKSFSIRENKSLECRVDFFNALNHANRSNPVSDIGAAVLDASGRIIDPQNFGRILASDSSPRILQLSLRFNF
jgi:Carboxypeptidase regulatory-like domain/TonB dependent receptor